MQWGRWTNEELSKLRELAGTMPALQVAAAIGRNAPAVQTKMRQLGLAGWPAGNPDKVGAALDLALRERPALQSSAAFARAHGIGKEWARRRARTIGVPFEKRRVWTPEMIATLQQECSRQTARQIAEMLGVAHACVRDKAEALGVRFTSGQRGPRVRREPKPRPPKVYIKAPWTPHEDQVLRDLAPSASIAGIATQLGRTARATWWRMSRIGLRRRAVVRGSARRVRMERGGVALRKREPRRGMVTAGSCIEWCGQCGSPVSNWDEHFERMGHLRPYVPRVA